MVVMSLGTALAPRTGKIIKNGLSVLERGENLLRNGLLHFVFRFSQSLEIALESYFSERDLALKGLKVASNCAITRALWH